ncbi:MAG: CRISPR-associated endonuclease Cas2 [Patescibacteria group bacterium]
MGKLEYEARALRRRGYLQKAILSVIGISGVLAVAIVAPNAIQALGKLGILKRFPDKSKKAISRLADKGYVVFETVNGKRCVRITQTGKSFLAAEAEREKLRSRRTKRKWDKRWRLIIFDIPERRKNTRDRLRREVISFGFLRLQDSVWVYPYECEELVALLKAELKIGKDVLYAIVEKIENDGWVRQKFNLPLK